jgi:hypothetical protein
MWFMADINLEAAASAEPALPPLAQARIRSDQLNTREGDVITGLFAVLESLVLRKRNSDLRRQRAQHRHRRLSRLLDEGHDGLNAGRGRLLLARRCRLQYAPTYRSDPTNAGRGRIKHRVHRRHRIGGSVVSRRCG